MADHHQEAQTPRRNPKRAKTETTGELVGAHEDLLDKACRPLTAQEIEDWPGWVELESEPAFFNVILHDLGVQDVKTREIFSIDQISSDAACDRVLGLIFLFQYEPDDEEPERESHPNDCIWFANQTTDDACATVALFNIIMNAPDVDLGPQLTAFKEATKDLDTHLRGHSITSNSFIRSTHNSFIRRFDQLNSDLALENSMDDDKSRRNIKKKKSNVDDCFHFIAYVPHDNHVWELDGLERSPLKLEPIHGDDWTAIVRPQIEARMLQYEDTQLSFNLLALCCSSPSRSRRRIASLTAALQAIQSHMHDNTAFRECIIGDRPPLDANNEAELAEFGLTISDVQEADAPAELLSAMTDEAQWHAQAYDTYREYQTRLKAAMVDFRLQVVESEEEERRVKSRKRDYGAVLHCWVKKLAAKGVLEDIINMSS